MKKAILILSVFFLLFFVINFSTPVFLNSVFANTPCNGPADCNSMICMSNPGATCTKECIDGVCDCSCVSNDCNCDMVICWERDGETCTKQCINGVCECDCVDNSGVVRGCTDQEATNYDSSATIDNGSCVYPAETPESGGETPESGGETPESGGETPESGGETFGGRTVAGSNIPLSNPITGKSGKPDIAKYVQGVIDVVLGLVGVLALTSFIYGGVLWMVSMGNSSLVEKGKKVMIWSVVGLLVVFSSYGILKIIFELFGYK